VFRICILNSGIIIWCVYCCYEVMVVFLVYFAVPWVARVRYNRSVWCGGVFLTCAAAARVDRLSSFIRSWLCRWRERQGGDREGKF
jgi:hypothetical protein